MARILDGRGLAAEVRARVKQKIAESKIKPGLAVILVGDDPASHLYVALKERACRDVGIYFEKFLYPVSIKTDLKALRTTLVEKITELNLRPDIHGILVQLPLPRGLNEDEMVEQITPLKDVDGFHPDNLARLFQNKPRITPGVTRGIVALIESTGIPLKDTRAVVFSNSQVFAQPLVSLLTEHGIHASVITGSESIDYQVATREADIVIVALGKPNLIRAHHLKIGSIVIDVGTNRLPDGRLVGDVDATDVATVAGWLTPVPGGVGPMTVAYLLENVVDAATRKARPAKKTTTKTISPSAKLNDGQGRA